MNYLRANQERRVGTSGAARDYRAAIASGQVTFENGEATGELPGKLIRGPQEAPAQARVAAE
jgi:N-acyl-D-amino-acid deacylase